MISIATVKDSALEEDTPDFEESRDDSMISPGFLAEICLCGAPCSEIQEGENGGLFFEEWEDREVSESNSDTDMGSTDDSGLSEGECDEEDQDEQSEVVSTHGLTACYRAPSEISLPSELNGASFTLSDEEM